MKRAVISFVLVIAGLSCFVDRRSSDFACDVDTDCAGLDGDRECIDNVCVEVECPSRCDDCDPGKVCNINCNQPNECRNGLTCPSGWNCEIACNEDCTPVTCVGALSCVVECNGQSSCGPLTCGTASPCSCTGTGCL